MENKTVTIIPASPKYPDFGDVVATAPLAAILQIALEAAVLPNKFEIDEQTPHSRLEALMEQAHAELVRYCTLSGESEPILRLVTAVFERVRVSAGLYCSNAMRERRQLG